MSAQQQEQSRTPIKNYCSIDTSCNNTIDNNEASSKTSSRPSSPIPHHCWSPSGSRFRDFLHFCGPGWIVCIAYVDPGNYQADINAGATNRYSALWAVWWTSLLSIYVQILCVRLSYYAQVTLAEVQAANARSKSMLYVNWFIAEFSTLITDIPEVIGIGIALNVFFGWPYYVGVLLSLITTMLFLATVDYGIRVMEMIIVGFVGMMSLALWIEMDFVGFETKEMIEGWSVGFLDTSHGSQLFSVITIIGSVVMPHNLYLHTASCMSRRVQRTDSVVNQAVKWCSFEPVFPITFSFFVNMAIVAIAAESVYGEDDADRVGLTDFCNYFVGIAKCGCVLWGVALLASGQSSAVTTTFTGQYVMDGFLNLRMDLWQRAILTRLVAITPCVILAAVFPSGQMLNLLVNFVNAALGFLLPFAFSPLVKFNCSKAYMGEYAAGPIEKRVLYLFAFSVWFINAYALSIPGGGFLGYSWELEMGREKVLLVTLQIVIQGFTIWWQYDCFTSPIKRPMRPLEQERPFIEGEFAMDTKENTTTTKFVEVASKYEKVWVLGDEGVQMIP